MHASTARRRGLLAGLLATVVAGSAAIAQQPVQAEGGAGAAPQARPQTNTAGTNATAPTQAGATQPHAGAAATAPTPRLLTPAEQEPAKQAEAKPFDEERALAERMDSVAQRWRKRAAAEGWQVHPPAGSEHSAPASR
jgi:hypothetical protein